MMYSWNTSRVLVLLALPLLAMASFGSRPSDSSDGGDTREFEPESWRLPIGYKSCDGVGCDRESARSLTTCVEGEIFIFPTTREIFAVFGGYEVTGKQAILLGVERGREPMTVGEMVTVKNILGVRDLDLNEKVTVIRKTNKKAFVQKESGKQVWIQRSYLLTQVRYYLKYRLLTAEYVSEDYIRVMERDLPKAKRVVDIRENKVPLSKKLMWNGFGWVFPEPETQDSFELELAIEEIAETDGGSKLGFEKLHTAIMDRRRNNELLSRGFMESLCDMNHLDLKKALGIED